MKLKSTKNFFAGIALASMAAVSGTAAAFDLNNCNGTGLACPWVTYGDGNSYSLALNAYIYDAAQGGGTGPSNPFFVQSSPGQISSLIVNATGSSGVPVVTNFPGMDNAYPTPSGVNGTTFFSMNKTAYGQPLTGNPPAYPADPGGAGQFTGDLANSWDTTVSALQAFLGAGNTPIFFFNNNQTSSGATTNQDIAVWAQITLTDSTGANAAKIFDFTNTLNPFAEPSLVPLDPRFMGNPGAYSSTGSGPVAGDNTSTDYVLSGGRLCILAGTPYPALIENLADGSCPAGTITINNNLGANQAAYAVVFPELNAFLLAGGYDSMHVDLRFGCDPNTAAGSCIGRDANNGYEQLFIASAAGVTVPEPATLALLGLGLMGLALSRRKARPVV